MAKEIPREKLDYVARNSGESISRLSRATGLSRKDVRRALEIAREKCSIGTVLGPTASALLVLVILVATFAAYFNSLDVSFHLDDAHVVRENPALRLDIDPETRRPSDPVSSLLAYFTDNTPVARGGEYYRPLLFVTYAWDFALSGVESTLSYHVTSVLLHALAAIMVGLLAAHLLKLLEDRWEGYAALRVPLSILAGVLFAVHPLLTEAVTYISGRSDALVSLLVLASLVSVLRFDLTGAKRWLWASFAFFAGALFSKEYGFLFLAFYLLIFMIIVKPERGKPVPWKRIAGYLALLAAFGIVYMSFRADAKVMPLPEDITPASYLASQPKVVIGYLLRMVFPSPELLTFNYDGGLFLHAPLWQKLSSGVVIIGIIVAALLLIRRYPFGAFGVIFIFIALAPTSSVFPIMDVIFERRAYLATAGFLFLLLEVAARLAIFVLRNVRRAVIAVVLVLAAVGALYAVGTYLRNLDYATVESLCLDTIEKSPTSSRSYYNLGAYYYKNRRFKEAVDLFLKTVELKPRDERNYYALGNTYMSLGDFDKAKEYLNKSLEVFPNRGRMNGQVVSLYPEAHYSLGKMNLARAAALFPRGERLRRDSTAGARAEKLLREAVERFTTAIWVVENNVAIREIPAYRESYRFRGEAKARLGNVVSTSPRGEDSLQYYLSARRDLEKARALTLYPQEIQAIDALLRQLPK